MAEITPQHRANVGSSDSDNIRSTEKDYPAVPTARAIAEEYAYTAPTSSWLYQNYLKPFYLKVGPTVFPHWIHPNVITILGFFFAYSSFLVVGYYSKWFTDRDVIPPYVLSLSALFCLLYVFCDSYDGIQARMLGLSSAVGELLDHGVDSVVATTLAQMIAFLFLGETREEKLRFGTLLILYFQYTFFVSHFISVVSGKLWLGFRSISTDEAMMLYALGLIVEDFFPHVLSLRRNSIEVPQIMKEYLGAEVLKFSVAEMVILVVMIAPGVFLTCKALRISKLNQLASLIQRIFFYVGMAINFDPYDAWWHFTWTPQYCLLVLSMILHHMKEESIPWALSLIAVATTRTYFPTDIMDPHKAACIASLLLFVVIVSEKFSQVKKEKHIPRLFRVPIDKQKAA